ncbi:MAG: GTPase Era [Chloroflexi bacterium]|nr:GTPase Era [Chloroflexota bacterium]
MEQNETPQNHRSGFVAVVGKPNVGKSTLINEYVGEKITIVSDKPQTTRRIIRGILTRPDAQIIFVDTPGIYHAGSRGRGPQKRGGHTPLLNRVMVESAVNVLDEVDIVVFVVDGSRPPTEEDKHIGGLLNDRAQVPVLLALNKSDLLKPIDVQPVTEAYWAIVKHADWMRVSATRRDNLDKLLDQILARLPEGPELFSPEQVTDQPLQVMAAELIREQVLVHTRQEIPHSIAVAIDEWVDRSPTLTHIGATIYVERDSQKGIVIGARGAMLKKIGQQARTAIEGWVGHQVYLELWVKVWDKWREREASLRELGYGGQ